MSDCINSEKPASGAAKNFPKERKTPSPVNQGKAGKRPHPALRATFPSQGKALYGAVQSCAPKGKYVLARRPVGPTWPSPLPSGGTSPIGKGKALMGIFLSVSSWGQYTPFPGKCPVSTSGRSPGPCPQRAAPILPAAAPRDRPGRPGADRSHPASGESGRAPCSGG